MSQIEYEQADGYAVVVMGREKPADAEWDRYVDFLMGMQARGAPPHVLVLTDGGSPTPAQRARLEQRVPEIEKARIAVVTDSTFARGVVNAFAFVWKGYRAFAPGALDEALEFLSVRRSVAPQVRAIAGKLKARMTGGDPA